MYDHTIHRGRKQVCSFCLQNFNTKKILKRHFKDVKQRIKIAKNSKTIKLQNLKRINK